MAWSERRQPAADASRYRLSWVCLHLAGDLNYDGVSDLAIGNANPYWGEISHRGRVDVLCGATGDLLFEIGPDGRLPRQR